MPVGRRMLAAREIASLIAQVELVSLEVWLLRPLAEVDQMTEGYCKRAGGERSCEVQKAILYKRQTLCCRL